MQVQEKKGGNNTGVRKLDYREMEWHYIGKGSRLRVFLSLCVCVC